MRERPDGLCTVVARQIGGPLRRDTVGLFQDRLRLAMAEPDRVADAERQQVGRMRIEDLPPATESFVERTAVPGVGRREMQPFARGDVRRTLPRARQRRIDLRAVGGVRRHQQQIRLEAMPHDEPRIRRDGAAGQRHRVGVELQIMFNRPVEQGDGLRTIGR